MKNLRLDGRTIGIGVIALIVIFLILPRLFGNNDTTTTGTDNDRIAPAGNDGAVDDNISLGRPVTAFDVDSDGCAVDQTTDFRATDEIWVVAPNSDMPSGTGVFVRLYREGEPIEDSREIVANQEYNNTCINFIFESANGFDRGSYKAEFYVNGNAADTVSFEVR